MCLKNDRLLEGSTPRRNNSNQDVIVIVSCFIAVYLIALDILMADADLFLLFQLIS